MRKNTKYKKILFLIFVFFLVISIPVGNIVYSKYSYNKNINLGEQNLLSDNFDEAVNNFQGALKYKKNNTSKINKNIKLIKRLKKSKLYYKQGMELYNNKNYLDAINYFNQVIKEDNKRYEKSQEKITECKNQYINELLSKAKIEGDKKNFILAISYADKALSIDSLSPKAIDIKYKYIKLDKENKELLKAEKERIEKEKANKAFILTSIPVLMYHHVVNGSGNELSIKKETFEAQMKYLKDNGYNTLNLDQAYNYINSGGSIPEKSVVLTFDDGYDDNYTVAFPILKKYGLKANIFVITSYINGNQGILTSDQIKEMYSYGIQFGSHNVKHDDLKLLSLDNQLSVLKDSKAALEKILGATVNYVAYPYGNYNSNTLKAVQSSGYKMAFTVVPGRAQKSNGIYFLHRIYVKNTPSMELFKKYLQ